MILFEENILKFHREIGEIKNDLLSNETHNNLEDQERYTVATKIDLTVSRLIRLLELNK